MDKGIFTSLKDIPVVLQAKDIQAVLGISKGKTYELMKRTDFPIIYLGKRMFVIKDDFFIWLSQEKQKN